MIRNRIKAIESRLAARNKPHGHFQIIESKKGLEKAKHEIEVAREKHPGYRIPFYRVFLAGALSEE